MPPQVYIELVGVVGVPGVVGVAGVVGVVAVVTAVTVVAVVAVDAVVAVVEGNDCGVYFCLPVQLSVYLSAGEKERDSLREHVNMVHVCVLYLLPSLCVHPSISLLSH